MRLIGCISTLLVALGLLFIGLSGCLENDARPYEDYLADLPEVQADANPAMPDAGPPLCSVPNGASITVEFSNETGRHGRLVWANDLCVTMQYANIRNGETYSQQTFVGHAWRLLREESDELLGQVLVAEGQTTVRFQ